MLPTNFHTRLWFTPTSESLIPPRFLIQPMDYRLYTQSTNSLMYKYHQYDFSDLDSSVINYCIVDYENIEVDGPNDSFSLFLNLPPKMREELLEFIYKVSIPEDSFISKLNTNAELVANPKFSDNSWNCHTCRERRLDRQRNCPDISTEDHDPRLKYNILGETYITCPMVDRDNLIRNSMIEAYTLYRDNKLPEGYCIGDQTVFLVLSARILEDRVKHYEREQIEQSKAPKGKLK